MCRGKGTTELTPRTTGLYHPNICYHLQNGADSCDGDSGGPLYCNDTIVGIVSYGDVHCGMYPAVYVKLSYYMDWIHAQKLKTENQTHIEHILIGTAITLGLVFILISMVIIFLKWCYPSPPGRKNNLNLDTTLQGLIEES